MRDTFMGKMGAQPFCLPKCPSKRSKVPLTKTLTFTVRANEALGPVQWSSLLLFYRPQSLEQGNVFTPVCDSFCSQEGLPSLVGGAVLRRVCCEGPAPCPSTSGQYASYWNAFFFTESIGMSHSLSLHLRMIKNL